VDSHQTYRLIRLIRRFEEKCLELKADGRIQGSMHLCSGQEAIAVGVCRALEARDALTVTYRGHGWAIARGLPLVDSFAELEGRESALCGGRGGSAYFSAPVYGFLGENSIVGAGMPIAAGAALAAKFDASGAVSVCAIGDGAMNQGGVHETLNMASVLRLPLVVVVENNLYSELTPIASMIATETLVERAGAYGIPGTRVDGNDADAVREAAATAVALARNDGGPSLIEAMTERLVGHYDLDPQHYRPRGEIESAMTREPLVRLRPVIGERQAAELDREVERELDQAIEEAEQVRFADTNTVGDHVYV